MVTKRGSEIRSFRSILTAACFRLSKCRAVCTESSVSFIGRRGSFSARDCRSYLRQFGCLDFSPPRADASDETVPTGKNDARTLRIRRRDFAHGLSDFFCIFEYWCTPDRCGGTKLTVCTSQTPNPFTILQ